jgi:hypothetical protein
VINKESDCQSYQMQVPRSELWQLQLKQLSFFLFHFCPINLNNTKLLCKLDCRIQQVKTKKKKKKKKGSTNHLRTQNKLNQGEVWASPIQILHDYIFVRDLIVMGLG